MINGRLWTVVSPNVGVPIFFLALMFTSLYIHYQVMDKTDWFPAFLKGEPVQVVQADGK